MNYKINYRPVAVVYWLLAILLFSFAIAGFTSCQSIDRFKDDMTLEWNEYVERDQDRWASYEAGQLTHAEFREGRREDVEALQEYTEERTVQLHGEIKTEIATATSGPITGNPMWDAIIGLVGTGVASAYGVNRMRNGARKKHGPAYTPK